MPDDSLRSHARWSLRAVLLDIMPRHAQAAGAFLCCPHASPFGTGPKGAKARPLSLPVGAKESGAKKSPGRPRRSTATMRPCCAGTCPYLRRSAQRAEASGCGHEPDDFVPFEARPARRASPFELRGRAQKVRFTPRSPPPSVPRRGNLLLSCQRDKRSKTASAFFVLRTQRNRNPRKVTHPVSWAGSGNARYVPKSSAQSRRGPPAQGFAACLRTQPRRVSQPGFGVQLRFYLSSLHYSTPRLGGAGTGKLRKAEIFGAAICAFDKLGANYRHIVYTPPCAPPEPRFGG